MAPHWTMPIASASHDAPSVQGSAAGATRGGSLSAADPMDPIAREARRRLVRAAGAFSRDVGLGRVVGELLMHLYLTDGPLPLERLEEELNLSKAAVSIAARRLETLGLVVRDRRPGDRRRYYRTADHIGDALRLGLLTLLRRQLDAAGAELEAAEQLLRVDARGAANAERRFLLGRVERASTLRQRMAALLRNPLARWLVRMK